MFTRLFRKTASSHTLRIAPAGREVTVQANETLLQAALGQGLAFPHNCRVGGCGSCKCRLVSGKVRELTDKSYLLSAEEMRDNIILACQSVPRSDVEIEVQLLDDASLPSSTVGTIERLERPVSDIALVTVALAQPVGFEPGQYATVSIHGRPGAAVRNYSFASIPGADGRARTVDFIIKHVPGGAFTDWLFGDARVGDRLEVSAPYGDFRLRESAAPMLCIAGGSGLAPVISMLRGALRDGTDQRDVTLLFGARRESDLYLQQEIDALARAWRGAFRYEPVLSHEPEVSRWPGRRGWIAQHLDDIMGIRKVAEHQAYLCGPPPMVDSCADALALAGLPADSMFCDRFLDASQAEAA